MASPRGSMEVLVTLTPTPEQLARVWCDWDSEKQAAFFNEIAVTSAKWDNDICFQLQWITDEITLTDAARSVMRKIGEYSER